MKYKLKSLTIFFPPNFKSSVDEKFKTNENELKFFSRAENIVGKGRLFDLYIV